jgi:Tfp pilus assembly protein PilN
MSLRMSAWRAADRVGVALGSDRIVALRLGGDREGSETWSRPLTPVPDGGAGWVDLAAAFEEMQGSFALGRAMLRIALLPSMVRVRRVELPRLWPDELRLVLARDAARYFPGPDDPRELAVVPCGRTRGSPVPYLMAAACGSLLDQVYRAAEPIGWGVECIAPAHEAWRAAALTYAPALRRRNAWLVVLGYWGIEALRLEHGRLAAIRRFVPGAFDRCAAVLAEPAGELAPVLAIVGAEASRLSLTTKLMECGVDVLEPPRNGDPKQTPEALAARFASPAAALALVPTRVREERVRRSARLSARLLAGAAASLALAAGIELWGAHRELDALAAQRALIRTSVDEAMRAREVIGGLDARLRVLASAESQGSRWAWALTDLAEHLPSPAHLTGLRGEADSLVAEGVAEHAAAVFESVAKASEFGAVRAAAPIRQEARDSGPAIERFTLAARLAVLPTTAADR